MRQRIVIADEGGTFAQWAAADSIVIAGSTCARSTAHASEGSNLVSPNGIGFLPGLKPQSSAASSAHRSARCRIASASTSCCRRESSSRSRHASMQTLQRSAEVRGVRRRSASDRSVRHEITHVSSFRGPRGLSDRQRATTAPASCPEKPSAAADRPEPRRRCVAGVDAGPLASFRPHCFENSINSKEFLNIHKTPVNQPVCSANHLESRPLPWRATGVGETKTSTDLIAIPLYCQLPPPIATTKVAVGGSGLAPRGTFNVFEGEFVAVPWHLVAVPRIYCQRRFGSESCTLQAHIGPFPVTR